MRPLRFMYRKLERIEVANLDFIRFFSSCRPCRPQRHPKAYTFLAMLLLTEQCAAKNQCLRHQATSDREPCDCRCANPNSAHKDPIFFFRLAVLPASYQVALDAKGRYRIGGGQITPRRSYLDQGGTTPLLRA